MFGRQWSIIVRVPLHMCRHEQFPRNISHSIYDLGGFEEFFCDQGLNHSLSFTCEIHGSWSFLLYLSPVVEHIRLLWLTCVSLNELQVLRTRPSVGLVNPPNDLGVHKGHWSYQERRLYYCGRVFCRIDRFA